MSESTDDGILSDMIYLLDESASLKEAEGRYLQQAAACRRNSAALKNIQAELVALREKVRWIPVTERLPGPDDYDLRGMVFIYAEAISVEYVAALGFIDPDDGWWVYGSTGERAYVTHWRRIDAPAVLNLAPPKEDTHANSRDT